MVVPSRRAGRIAVFIAATSVLLEAALAAQGLTGALIGTVTDASGLVLPSATVRVTSPALLGGPVTVATNEKGQLRFVALPPGLYALDIEYPGFTPFHEDGIEIGAGATIERTARLKVEGVSESVVVEGAGSRIEARAPGFATRFDADDIGTIPTRRASMFDWIRAAPGISATSPSSGTATTISAFGSGTNENQFLIDGTNFTCPCNGVARAEPGVDFIQEVQVQAVGASAEFGNMQGAVINVVTKQGGDRFRSDTGYFAQFDGLTSQPVQLVIPNSGNVTSGYERERYRDLTTSLGGPVIRHRLWFFGAYQYLRDYDSQPGTDPALPRAYEQNKAFGKLTWRLGPGWQLEQNLHYEYWVSPDQPTIARPYETTLRVHASVPAVTFARLTHTSSNSAWDMRVGRFVFSQESPPITGDYATSSRSDQATGYVSAAPPQFSKLDLVRTTAKATVNYYRPAFLGADHEWKLGAQVEQGGHETPIIIPTGIRHVDNRGVPVQSVASAPSNTGGQFITGSAFVSDALTLGARLTINAGLRFDYNRAISQDIAAVDMFGNETGDEIEGLGTLYTWNVWSPRLGVTARLTDDGRTILRASYGRFNQGVLTGEIGPFHPGATPVTTTELSTGVARTVDPKANLVLDADTRTPRTDEYSIGVDHEVGGRMAIAMAYIHKEGANFIGWNDVGGQYAESTRPLPDGRSVPVFNLTNAASARRFLLTNQDDYSMTYNGLVMVLEKRRSQHWQAFGSYTFSKTTGLLPSNLATPLPAQVSTVAPPPAPVLTFGRDPNDLTNARGRLLNDRPHSVRLNGSVDIPWGLMVAANFGYYSGRPWAATAVVPVTQNSQQRVQIETRGTRRLSSQSLLDIRLSKTFAFGANTTLQVTADVLNVLNDTAEEALASDNFYGPTFGQPTTFIDPRRAMLGVKLNLGR
jgi:hypothetical protein